MKLDRDDADDLIVLTRVAHELAPLIVGEPPPYRATASRIRNANVSADLVEYIRGRYYVRRSNLPAFAQALGLQLKQPAPPRPARSHASCASAA
jgi:hypothetical protein